MGLDSTRPDKLDLWEEASGCQSWPDVSDFEQLYFFTFCILNYFSQLLKVTEPQLSQIANNFIEI